MKQQIITSINYSQTDIIQNIIQLYIPQGKIDADVTYSKGIFYKDGVIAEPQYKFDIAPQNGDTIQADCRNLPLADNSINSLIFDPPFLATSGKSLTTQADNNLMLRRFGYYRNEKELHKFYQDSFREFNRVLSDNGILIVKCQDKISSGKQYLSHVFIIQQAIEQDFYPEDIFILLAKSRIVADWQARSQKHARKFHSYFIVFRKSKLKIEYL